MVEWIQLIPMEVSRQFLQHCLGKIKPGLRKEVGGSFTFFSPKVAGLFFMFCFPVLALLSAFFFFGNGAGKDSNSNKF